VVQANLLAATAEAPEALNQVYYVAVGGRMSLNQLATTLAALVQARHRGLQVPPPVHDDFRAGDVRHSQADIGKAQRLLGYAPSHDVRAGLREALPWYEAELDTASVEPLPARVDAAAR
jgi:UDP-N-acetylglucosamine 4-epimerase